MTLVERLNLLSNYILSLALHVVSSIFPSTWRQSPCTCVYVPVTGSSNPISRIKAQRFESAHRQ